MVAFPEFSEVLNASGCGEKTIEASQEPTVDFVDRDIEKGARDIFQVERSAKFGVAALESTLCHRLLAYMTNTGPYGVRDLNSRAAGEEDLHFFELTATFAPACRLGLWMLIRQLRAGCR